MFADEIEDDGVEGVENASEDEETFEILCHFSNIFACEEDIVKGWDKLTKEEGKAEKKNLRTPIEENDEEAHF